MPSCHHARKNIKKILEIGSESKGNTSGILEKSEDILKILRESKGNPVNSQRKSLRNPLEMQGKGNP